MLRRLPLWVVLNTYAWVLDGVSLAIMILAIWCACRYGTAWASLFVLPLLFAMRGAIDIHSSYPYKLHIYTTLLTRNRRTLSDASFKKFLSAPCLRLVVRTVLARTGNSYAYKRIMKKYYRPIWCHPAVVAQPSVVIFNTPDEGRQWLASHWGDSDE